MFVKGTVSGEFRTMYSAYNQKEPTTLDSYTTASGAIVKYQTAVYQNVGLGFEALSMHALNFASGNGNRYNSELASADGDYSQLSQAYMTYEVGSLNIRAGRRVIETPYANSDDYLLVPNTFQAYTLAYEIGKFSFRSGFLKEWQGAGSGLSVSDPWQDTGAQGTLFAGLERKGKKMHLKAWYYDISALVRIHYIDAKLKSSYGDFALQYIDQTELDNSGSAAHIYGLFFQRQFSDFTVNVAYNASQREIGKSSFAGYGMGPMYVDMDNNTLDTITQDRDAKAYALTMDYLWDQTKLIYAFATFKGDTNGANKAHLTEQNFQVEHERERFVFLTVVTIVSDKHNSAKTNYDFVNTRFGLRYKF